MAENLEYGKLAAADDYGPIRWFHEAGVTQVVTFDHKVFRFK